MCVALFKEMYILQKRRLYIKRNVYSKETHKRDPQKGPNQKEDPMYSKKNICISKETYKRDLYTSKETCAHQKRPLHIKRDLYTSKETNVPQKRPMHIKRDQYIRRPTDNIKRDLQKRRTKVTSV